MSLSSTSTRGVFFGTLAPEKKIDNCWFKITFTHCHQHISKQAWSYWEVIKCGAMPPWEKKIKTPSPSPSFPLPPSWCSFPLYAPSFHLSKWENYHMKANKKNADLLLLFCWMVGMGQMWLGGGRGSLRWGGRGSLRWGWYMSGDKCCCSGLGGVGG